MKQTPIHSRLQVNEHRKSMRRKPCTPENEWGENKLTTKSYVPFYTQPNRHSSQSLCCASWLRQRQEDKRKKDPGLYSGAKNREKHSNDGRRKGCRLRQEALRIHSVAFLFLLHSCGHSVPSESPVGGKDQRLSQRSFAPIKGWWASLQQDKAAVSESRAWVSGRQTIWRGEQKSTILRIQEKKTFYVLGNDRSERLEQCPWDPSQEGRRMLIYTF